MHHRYPIQDDDHRVSALVEVAQVYGSGRQAHYRKSVRIGDEFIGSILFVKRQRDRYGWPREYTEVNKWRGEGDNYSREWFDTEEEAVRFVIKCFLSSVDRSNAILSEACL